MEPEMKPVVLIYSLSWEVRGLEKRAPEGFLFIKGGVGREGAVEGFRKALRLEPSLIVSFGFCGSKGLGTGTLVLPRLISREGREREAVDEKIWGKFREVLLKEGIRFVDDELVTVPRIIKKKDEVPFEVFDMESFWLLSEARRMGIPFIALKSVSDSGGDELPDLDPLLDGKGFSVRLGDVPKYIRLFLGSVKARRSLKRVLEALR